jgi:ribosomal protein L12E/L44/L45/RPP1/RPP2
MTFNIKPQDKRPAEKIEFELHPDLIQRLKNLAQSLNDSDVNYVLTQILEQALPPEKPAKKERAERAPKPSKETPRRAA